MVFMVEWMVKIDMENWRHNGYKLELEAAEEFLTIQTISMRRSRIVQQKTI